MKKRSLFILASFLLAAICLLSFMEVASPWGSAVTPAQAYDGGYALEFDGTTDWAEIGPNSTVIGPNWQYTKTISVWIKPAGPGPNASFAFEGDLIVGDDPRWFGIFQANVNGRDRIWIANADNSSTDGSPIFVFLPIEYTVGQWVNITLTHGNGVLKAYKNGTLVGSALAGPTAFGHPGAIGGIDLRFGGSITVGDGGYIGPFAGQIDELRIYSIELTEAEIRQGLDQPLTGNEPGLSAYYQMSDGSGTIVSDDSINNNSATLYDGLGTFVPPDGNTAAWVPSGNFEGPNFNDAPTFTSTPVTTATENVPYIYAIVTDDPDLIYSDTLTLTAPTLPAWLALTDHGDGTATLSGTPNNANVGDHAVVLRVTDNEGLFAEQAFTITVANVNNAPEFSSAPVTTATEDVLYTYAIATADPDLIHGDTLTLTAPTLPAWLIFEDHGDGTATLSGTPTNTDVGAHAVVLRVTDSAGAFAEQVFMITVAEKTGHIIYLPMIVKTP